MTTTNAKPTTAADLDAATIVRAQQSPPSNTVEAALSALSARLLEAKEEGWHIDEVERVVAAVRPLLRPGTDVHPSVSYLRAEVSDDVADDVSTVVDWLSISRAPTFLRDMPKDKAPASSLTDADYALGTDLWPDSDRVTEALSCLASLFASEGSARLAEYGPFAIVEPYYNRPRVELVNADHVFAASLTEVRSSGRSWDRATIPEGHTAYLCSLTKEPFCLQTRAAVPCLVFDTETSSDAPSDAFTFWPIHPALVEAGPDRTLWAVWKWIDTELFDIAHRLALVGSMAHTFAGMGPENLTTERAGHPSSWPSLAFRHWVHTAGQTTGMATVPVADFRDPDGGPKRLRKTA